MKKDQDAAGYLATINKRAYTDMPPYRSTEKSYPTAFGSSLATLITKKGRPTSEGKLETLRNRLAAEIAARMDGLRAIQREMKANRGPNDLMHVIHIVDILPEGPGPGIPSVDMDDLYRQTTFIVRSKSLFQDVQFPGWEPRKEYDDVVVIDAMKRNDTMDITFHAVSECLMGIRRIHVDYETGLLKGWPAEEDPRPLYRRFQQVLETAMGDGTGGDAEPDVEGDGPVDGDDVGDPFVEPAEAALTNFQTAASIGRLCDRHPSLTALYQLARPLLEDGYLETQTIVGLEDGDTFYDRYFMWRMSKFAPGIRKLYKRADPFERTVILKTVKDTVSRPESYRIGIYSAAARILLKVEQEAHEGNSSFDIYKTAVVKDRDPDITGHASTSGIIVVRDRALFELASSGRFMAIKTRREVPIVVLYDRRENVYDTLVMQMDGGEMNLADWRHVGIAAKDEDDALDWYLRDLIAVSDTRAELPIAAETDDRIEEKTDDYMPPSTIVKETVQIDATPVEQADAQLDLGDLATEAPEVIRSADRPHRPVCRVKVKASDHDQACSIIDLWCDEQIRRLGTRMISDDRAPGRWRQEQRTDMTATSDLWAVTVTSEDAEVEVEVSTTAQGAVSPRLPRLLRQLAQFPGITGPDGPIADTAVAIITRSRLSEFMRLATDPQRRLPILLMSSTENGKYIASPDDVAAKAACTMHVYTISPSLAFHLTDAWGRGLSAYGGAARLYQTDFDASSDSSYRHPLFLFGTSTDEQVDKLISRETEATLHRYADIVVVEPDEEDVIIEHPEPHDIGDDDVGPLGIHHDEKDEDCDRRRELDPTDIVTVGDAPPQAVPAEEVAVPEPEQDRIPSRKRRTEKSRGIGPADDDLSSILAAILTRLDGIDQQMSSIVDGKPVQHDDLAAAAQIATLRNEIAVERKHAAELLAIAEEERDEAIAEREKLRIALETLRRSDPEMRSDAKPYPESLADLEPWADQHLVGRVVILPRAYRAMRKIKYRDMDRLCRTLELLAGPYVDMKQGVDGAKDIWEEGIKELRIEIKKQTLLGASANESEYYFRYQGEKLLLDRHIRGIEKRHNDEAHLLRIYFHYHQDPRTGGGRVLIGHLPTHLTSSAS